MPCRRKGIIGDYRLLKEKKRADMLRHADTTHFFKPLWSRETLPSKPQILILTIVWNISTTMHRYFNYIFIQKIQCRTISMIAGCAYYGINNVWNSKKSLSSLQFVCLFVLSSIYVKSDSFLLPDYTPFPPLLLKPILHLFKKIYAAVYSAMEMILQKAEQVFFCNPISIWMSEFKLIWH